MGIDPSKFREFKIRLEQQKRNVEEQLRAIEVVEKLFEQLESEDNQMFLPVTEGKYSQSTAREACLDLINSSDKDWTAREVVGHMKAGGYEFTTNTPVASISTTLNRLANGGKIKLIKSGTRNMYRHLKLE